MINNAENFLRHLRWRNNENLAEMAQKLSISSSYLSQIENRKKNITNTFLNRLCDIYALTDQQKKNLILITMTQNGFINIKWSPVNHDHNKEILLSLDEDKIKELIEIIVSDNKIK